MTKLEQRTLNKFERFVLDNYKNKLKSIAEHGCASVRTDSLGCYLLYNEFVKELHEMLANYLEVTGGLIPKGFCNALKAEHTFKDWMVCFNLETVAYRFTDPVLHKEYQEGEHSKPGS